MDANPNDGNPGNPKSDKSEKSTTPTPTTNASAYHAAPPGISTPLSSSWNMPFTAVPSSLQARLNIFRDADEANNDRAAWTDALQEYARARVLEAGRVTADDLAVAFPAYPYDRRAFGAILRNLQREGVVRPNHYVRGRHARPIVEYVPTGGA